MTETSAPIDPKRPWIDDPRDAPATLNWIQSLTNPAGMTSRVHFTRVWTGLFFFRLLYRVIVIVGLFILGAAGVNDVAALAPPVWVWPMILLVTVVLSAILHIRRLNDAGRSPLWASLVVVPLLFGLIGFTAGAGGAVGEYEQAVEAQSLRDQNVPPREIVERLDLQGADKLRERVRLLQERAEAIRNGSFDPATAEQLDGDEELPTSLGEIEFELAHMGQKWSELLPVIEVTEVSARDFAIQGGVMRGQMLWGVSSFFVMLWSLLWVGRLPNGGGTIRSRFEPAAPAG